MDLYLSTLYRENILSNNLSQIISFFTLFFAAKQKNSIFARIILTDLSPNRYHEGRIFGKDT